ncbi:MAG: NAD-dependent epimerase/dehydratase family protein [Gammaproteobacteria bacterium]
MKILITGASGFFGKSLINALEKTANNFECIGVCKSTSLQFTDVRFRSINCDLLNIDAITKLIDDVNPTHLVHLAWYVTPNKFWEAKENIDWLHTSIKLFQKFCENNGQVFVGAGTLAEYDWSNGVLDEEKTHIKPSALYGQSKKSLHEIILCIKRSYGYKTKIIWPRIGYFFGCNEPREKLISKIIYNLKQNSPIELASPKLKRPYADVKYFGQIVNKLIIMNELQDLTFNMSTSVSYTLKEIVDFIKQNLCQTFSEINYNSCQALPVELLVKTECLRGLGIEIPNTFFEDLKLVLEKNRNLTN